MLVLGAWGTDLSTPDLVISSSDEMMLKRLWNHSGSVFQWRRTKNSTTSTVMTRKNSVTSSFQIKCDLIFSKILSGFRSVYSIPISWGTSVIVFCSISQESNRRIYERAVWGVFLAGSGSSHSWASAIHLPAVCFPYLHPPRGNRPPSGGRM